MNAYGWVKHIEGIVHGFHSTEGNKRASNREIRQWLKDGAIHINGERVNADTEIDEFQYLVLFPKSKKKTTIGRYDNSSHTIHRHEVPQ